MKQRALTKILLLFSCMLPCIASALVRPYHSAGSSLEIDSIQTLEIRSQPEVSIVGVISVYDRSDDAEIGRLVVYEIAGEWQEAYKGVFYIPLFQGREWDANAGQYYFRYRIEIPEWGTFTGQDMNLAAGIFDEAMGIGSYAALANDPVNNNDPLGLDVEFAFRVSCAFGAGRVEGGAWSRYISDLQYTVGARYDFDDNVEAQVGISVRGHGSGRGRTGSSNLGGTAGDVTAYGLLSYYKGDGSAGVMPQYTLNAHTVTPFDNTYDTSFTWGMAFNRYMWASDDLSSSISAFNVTSFLQYRNADMYAFYYNDKDSLLKLWPSREADRYWTAGALVGMVDDEGSRFELAWDCFTGDIPDRRRRHGNNIYDQPLKQQALNRSDWLFRYSPSGDPLTFSLGYSSPYYLNPQNWVHWGNNLWDSLPAIPFVKGPPLDIPPCGLFEFDSYAEPELFFNVGAAW